MPSKLNAHRLVRTIAKHWRALILEESSEGSIPEGNRQFIIPPESDLVPKFIKFHVFAESALLDFIMEGESNYGVSFDNINAKKIHEVSERIELYLRTRKKTRND